MELTKINGSTYFIQSATNVGIYTFKNKNCILIDSGISNTTARKIDDVIIQNNLHPKYIINTHSHVDHCGGNNYFINKYPGCIVYTSEKEKLFMENPEIYPYTLFNSYPIKSIKKSNEPIRVDYVLEYGINKINDEKIEILSLKGHSIEHIGIITPDRVCFLGDSIFSEDILSKYSFPYLYSIDDSLSTLEAIKNIDADYFVVSHALKLYNSEEIISLSNNNIQNIQAYLSQCLTLLEQPQTKETLLENIVVLNDLAVDFNEYYLNFSAVSAFISYLFNQGMLESFIEDGKLYFYKA